MEQLCGACRQEDYDFDMARSYGLYSGSLRTVILQLKFRGRERLGERLGEFLASAWHSAEEFMGDNQPVVVPVPLHPTRERERGFNQAELLAWGMVRRVNRERRRPGLGVEKRCLRRVQATASQAGLTLHARRENVRGVFAVAQPQAVRDRAVVLVDDVLTTGATLSECARVLKRGGALKVVALTLARATPQFPVGPGPIYDVPVDEPAGK